MLALLAAPALLSGLAVSGLAVPSPARGADLDVRLRVVWGGGEPRAWQGTIRLSAGTLADPRPLGLEADTPGSMHLVDQATLQVFPRTPRSYDGVDLHIQAPADAMLIVELAAADGEALALEALDPIELPLAQVLKRLEQVKLDDRKNYLLAQRAPGDALRVSLARDSLVFTPGEKLELTIEPNRLDLAASTGYELVAKLTPARSDDEIKSEDYEIKTDSAGHAEPLPLAIGLPQAEGIYDLKLALYPKRLTSAIVRPRAAAQRTVQVVVVVVGTARPIDRTVTPWRTAYDLDPANPSWWERMARMPSLRRLPTIGAQQLASGPTKKRTLLGKPWIELAGDAWQAYPLTIDSPGQPHLIEVEYVSDHPQSLGISLIEPNAMGRVEPVGLDSGFEVLPAAAGHDPQIKRHRLLFWPRTRTPWVLLANRHNDRPALVGRITVLAGPLEPPALAIPPSAIAGRTLAAYFDRPLIAENFSATKALDPASGRAWDDWLTFYQAGERMVAALKHGGYSAVILNVVHDGSALYPSQLLAPTPKYDTGTFFDNGQDPIRKDVLELIFRLCDRAGIQVIPAVQFAAPLPELEALRLAGGAAAEGLEPIGPDGRTWLANRPAGRATGVYYNPLDERVQKAMKAVIAELGQRYGTHASFGGVAVQWTTDSYAILPDDTCSYDDVTIGRFEESAKVTIPEAMDVALGEARARFLKGDGEKAWLAWRSQRVAEMYRRMHGSLAEVRASARLYLLPADLLGSQQLQNSLRPVLPPAEVAGDVLARLGIDPRLYASQPGIVLPRPYRVAAGAPDRHQSLVGHWNQSAELDALFAGRGAAAAIHFHEPRPLALPDFDKVSPFGADKTRTLLLAQISPADAANRERLVHSLAQFDSSVLIDGGVLLPLGQEESLAPLVKVFRRLPAERFVTATTKTARTGQDAARLDATADAVARGIVVRTHARGNKTWFYVVNDTPWTAHVEIDFAGGDSLRVVSYAEDRPAKLDDIDGGVSWTITLAPHDLAGGELNSGRVTVADYRASFLGDPAQSLQQQIRGNQLRANALRRPEESRVLINPSFDVPAREALIPGWDWDSVPAQSPGGNVAVDAQGGHGDSHSLRLTSRPPARGQAAPIVWVRSEPFELPATGRVTLSAWLRTAEGRKQPQLRLAVEGKRNDQVHYQYGQVGLDNNLRPAGAKLTTEWTSCSVTLTDLPLEGLKDVRVGFDLMGEGDVWIDKVEVHSLLFADSERDALLNSGAAAQVQLSHGKLADCQRFVSGYWPSFLRQHVPLPAPRTEAAFAPPTPAAPTPGTAPPAAKTAAPSTWDKWRSMFQLR